VNMVPVSMATPYNPRKAPRETTEQDVPLARQPVVRRHPSRPRKRPREGERDPALPP
jgi:hypothetical protein